MFLAVLLALMAPGAVILFNKKSIPGERPVGAPDPVRKTTAYMDPYPPESVQRLAPMKTLDWIAALALGDAPSTAPVAVTRPVDSPPPPPLSSPYKGSGNVGASATFKTIPLGVAEAQVVSDGRWFQVVSRGTLPDGRHWVRVLVWDEDADPAKVRFSAAVNGSPAEITASRIIPVPKPVRHDLQDTGFVLPPERITLLDITSAQTPTTLSLSHTGRHPKSQSASLPQ